MKNITFYTYPKPWIKEYADIQACAITSWKTLLADPTCQIVLLGDDQGTAQAAKELGVVHRGSVERNEWGTPIVSSIMDIIRVECPTELSCFINTDIVLPNDFMDTVNATHQESLKLPSDGWLMIGQRTDVETSGGGTTQRMIGLHGVDGIDYFVFPRNTFQFVYPFALGKFTWDQWLVGNVYRRGLMCVDATKTVLALHLNAKWFFQGQPNGDWKTIFNSQEARINRDFDYYQRNIANGTTHYTVRTVRTVTNGVNVIAKTLLSPW
jgi:hypothetical protein